MSRRPGDLLLRAGLELVDAVAGVLPQPVAYGLADLLGEAWYRFAPSRRRLVAAQMARVSEATGRPASGAALRRLVRAAFVAHARYYLEVVRVPRIDPQRVDEVMTWQDDGHFEELAHRGAVIVVSAHFGNFEPGALWLARRGLRWIGPIERIQPRALFEYLLSRRGARSTGGELVVPPDAGRRVLRALREGAVVAIAADRDLGTPAVEVTFFGHPARVPSGPATLALLSEAPIVVVTVRRSAPGRFRARSERIEWTAGGDREADVVAITQRIAAALERHIGEAPEQWWGTFQPVWTDFGGPARRA
jgi:KDO2-lipid IV(A) lauroyltransferase